MDIYLDNDNLITLTGLANGADNTSLPAATVSVTLLDSTESEVAGETWPLAMSSAGGGTYEATLTKDLTLAANGRYTAKVIATDSGTGLDGQWNVPVIAKTRTSS